MANLRDLSRQLQSLQRQIPYAMARALTSTARQIQEAEKVKMQRVLQSPTPFTVNAVGSIGARKDNLVAKVFVRNIAAAYLEPFEFGGVHKLNSQALLNPKDIRLNKYGNLTKNKLAQLKARRDVFIGTVDGVNGVWQRVKVKAGRKGKKRLPRSAKGTRRERSNTTKLRLLIRFGNALPVQEHLGYMKTAQTMADRRMPGEMSKALDEAMRTAR
ncbi:hypothetical protein [Martelella alba]|uniref:Minor tail protein Z (GPZ) n=1 Tax=Martelella alba TaxID=2590451 RepID=A0ABY2SEJ7_9HYPH|nr:hypothetical protein [Martelella alba]TKI02884.1 hypothetical protein FCN80_23515 [Martelella alba]